MNELDEIEKALDFYGPTGDFDCGDYELKITKDGYGDLARVALALRRALACLRVEGNS